MIPSLLLMVALQTAANDPVGASGAPSPPPAAAPVAPPSVAAVPPPLPAGSAPAAPAGADPAPRRIDDLGHPLTGAVPQGSYEAGVKGAFSRTQSLQGPLDGTWILKDAAGTGLYRFQLVDPGFGGGRIEGAWSDLHAGPASASGFFTEVVRDGTKLTLQFNEPGLGLVAAALDVRPGGGFAGDLTSAEAGRESKRSAVTLVRP